MVYFHECKDCKKRIISESPNLTDYKEEDQYFIDYHKWEDHWYLLIKEFDKYHNQENNICKSN